MHTVVRLVGLRALVTDFALPVAIWTPVVRALRASQPLSRTALRSPASLGFDSHYARTCTCIQGLDRLRSLLATIADVPKRRRRTTESADAEAALKRLIRAWQRGGKTGGPKGGK